MVSSTATPLFVLRVLDIWRRRGHLLSLCKMLARRMVGSLSSVGLRLKHRHRNAERWKTFRVTIKLILLMVGSPQTGWGTRCVLSSTPLVVALRRVTSNAQRTPLNAITAASAYRQPMGHTSALRPNLLLLANTVVLQAVRVARGSEKLRPLWHLALHLQ
jgi:hypothetical protein